MPKAYFEPENLNALIEVFTEAKRRLNSQDINDPARLDFIASRILALAANGVHPSMILQEIAPQVEGSTTFVAQGDADEASAKAAVQSTQ